MIQRTYQVDAPALDYLEGMGKSDGGPGKSEMVRRALHIASLIEEHAGPATLDDLSQAAINGDREQFTDHLHSVFGHDPADVEDRGSVEPDTDAAGPGSGAHAGGDGADGGGHDLAPRPGMGAPSSDGPATHRVRVDGGGSDDDPGRADSGKEDRDQDGGGSGLFDALRPFKSS